MKKMKENAQVYKSCIHNEIFIDTRAQMCVDTHTRALMKTCIYNLNYYLIYLIFIVIFYNYDACYHSFMNFLHWYAILLKFIFLHNLGLIMCFNDL